ncbi:MULTISPECIES: barstar family protein [Caldilinea]|jgi:hypothetical protein|uniref:Barstar (barnase inhibitor) domain-containing protein n=1 Tax=Caldilinea aerophila (strain DSM 14535 / JCM 11387 / NBRC 104270 / STL-6-O1) TaxID=926550 RepID=I0I268_CALAS|nr:MULTISPECIES: barstar family protein [Caldilinea]BAL99355.1 hypothetical protein CLDAP_13160 [Caldilinea aerophila DSM 14535 = NBRC 104270]GIV74051.1 MAG: hypothetical protein KatS3mg049_2607 [Caldilinea sp.]
MNDIITSILLSVPSGLYRWLEPIPVRQFMQSVDALGWRFFYLDGRRARDKASFLRAIAETMAFPDYFGKNWDAFEECVNDLTWAPASGYVLLYEHVWWFACTDPGEWRIARSILEDVCINWARQEVKFFVLLRHTHGCSGVDAMLRAMKTQ